MKPTSKTMIIGFAILILCIIVLISFNPPTITILPEDETITYNYSYIIETCSDLNLTETAYCMNQILRQVPYNESNFIYVGDEDFFREGGVCRHFSDTYKKAAKELGFKTHTDILEGLPPHEFVIIYDDPLTAYVKLDIHDMYITYVGEPE